MRLAKFITRTGIAASIVSLPLGISVATGLMSSLEDPERVLLWVSVPGDAMVGERITLVITIENAREGAPFHLEDIDIEGAYLNGFAVGDMQPVPVDHYTVDGGMTLEYNTTVPARFTQRFYIELQPKTPGVYLGDVDVWGSENEEGGRFCTARAQTKVE